MVKKPRPVIFRTFSISTSVSFGEPTRTKSFEDTVRDYLAQELTNHDEEQRVAVLARAEDLLKEVQT